MAIREELVLDLSQALSQLDDLERSLDSLLQPITIPVKVDDDAGLERLARDADRAEDEFEDLRQEVDRTDDGLEKVERQAKATGDDLERAGKKGKGAFSGLTKGVLAFGAALGGIAALRAVGGFFADSISAASDLEESVGKATVVFGEFFGDIEEFTSTAPQALGLSTAAALEFTGTFGNLFVALGLTQGAAADLAPEIVQLGADLASFNNLEVTDALDKLRAGLVGEAEPLRALGVNLTAATTNAKALELGLVDANGVVTEAGKVQARYALILEQTATAQGDFDRTSDGLANRQRTLTGLWEDAKAAIGEALVPAFEALLDLAPALIEAIETGLVPALESFSASIASIDTEALAIGLAQIPAIMGGTVGVFNSATQGLINFVQAGAALTRLDMADAIEQTGQAIEDFDNIFAKGIATKAITNLIVTMGKGATPVEAFEAVLVELGESVSNLDLEQFEVLADQLVAIADLEDIDIVNLVASIKKFGPAAGFSAAGVEILVQSLLEARSAAGTLPPPLDEVARGIARAGEAADEAAPLLSGFGEAGEEIRDADIDGIIADLEAQFGRLPDALDAAAAALRDAEGEIITDFGVFFDNLDAELAEREDLADLVTELIGRGFPLLAELLVSEGLDALNTFLDGLTDPASLARGEARLEEFARALARAEASAFLAEIQDQIANADEFIVAITPVLGDLDFGGLPILENLVLGGVAPAGNIIVNQVFENTPSPTTETARAAQSVSNIR